jgi:hypothetical protein
LLFSEVSEEVDTIEEERPRRLTGESSPSLVSKLLDMTLFDVFNFNKTVMMERVMLVM